MTEAAEDGRVARGQRTREAVIDALVDEMTRADDLTLPVGSGR
jgi:hypothetical protein